MNWKIKIKDIITNKKMNCPYWDEQLDVGLTEVETEDVALILWAKRDIQDYIIQKYARRYTRWLDHGY